MKTTGYCGAFLAVVYVISSPPAAGSESKAAPFPQNGVTAHRGNSGEHPENTLPAFRSGIELGADWLTTTMARMLSLGIDRLYTDYPGRVLALKKRFAFRSTRCEGMYPHHLQGICTNERDALFWSFTTTLVKTDVRGKVLRKIPVANHHGDLCFHDRKIYVAVNLGKFNDPAGNADSWVYVYDADNLSLLKKHETQQVFHGAGGIGVRGGHFFLVGGLPVGIEENYVYEYDADFRFVKKHTIKTGNTLMGIQTATYANGHWWFGCYGTPPVMIKTDASFRLLGKVAFDCSLGIVGLPHDLFLVAGGRCQQDAGCSGSVTMARTDAEKGLVK